MWEAAGPETLVGCPILALMNTVRVR